MESHEVSERSRDYDHVGKCIGKKATEEDRGHKKGIELEF